MYWKPLLNVDLINGTEACHIRVTNPMRNATESKLKVQLPLPCLLCFPAESF